MNYDECHDLVEGLVSAIGGATYDQTRFIVRLMADYLSDDDQERICASVFSDTHKEI